MLHLADQASLEALADTQETISASGFSLDVTPEGQVLSLPPELDRLSPDFLSWFPASEQARLSAALADLPIGGACLLTLATHLDNFAPGPLLLSMTRSNSDRVHIALYPDAQRTGAIGGAQSDARATRALSVLAETVSTQLSVDKVLQVALDQVLETLAVEAGAITLLDAKAEKLIFRAQKGWHVHDFVAAEVHLSPIEGMAGLVMRTGEPAVTLDVATDERIIFERFRDEPVKAMVMTPLRARGRVLGILSMMSYQPRRFTLHEVTLLAAVADQVGVAIDNAALYERDRDQHQAAVQQLARERRRARQMTTLREATLAMSRAGSLEKALDTLASAMLSLSSAPIVEIGLINPSSETLSFGTARRASGETTALHLNQSQAGVESSFAQAAIKHNRIFVHKLTHPIALDLEHTLSHLVAVPMAQRIPNGVILLGFAAEPALDADARASLLLMAGQASAILDRLQLFKEEQRRTSHLTLVNQISRRAVADLRHENLPDEVLEMLRSSFDLSGAALYLGTPPVLLASSGGDPAAAHEITVNGLAALAIQNHHPMFSGNVAADKRCVAPAWIQAEARSELAAPLLQGDHCIGVLDLFSKRVDAFDAMDLQTMMTLASQLAVVLDSRQLYDQMERRLAELATIQEISLRLLNALDTQSVANTLVRPLAHILSADAVIIYEAREGKLWQQSAALIPPTQNVTDETLRPLAQEALRLREPLVYGCIEGLLWNSLPWSDSNSSGFIVPLSDAGVILGVLVVHFAHPSHLDVEMHRMLNLLSNMTAAAMSKAMLYEGNLQQVKELGLLYKVALNTHHMTETVEVAHRVTEALQQAMGWSKVELYQWKQSANGLLKIGASDTEQAYLIPRGKGIVGWVAQSKEPLVLNPPQSTSPYSPPSRLAEIAVPLSSNGELLGVLYARGSATTSFNTHDQDFLTTLGHLVAVILSNIALYDKTQSQLEETTALYYIARCINQVAPLETTLQQVAAALAKALRAHGIRVMLVDESAQHLAAQTALGLAIYRNRATEDESLPLQQGILAAIVARNGAVYIPDTYRDKDYILYHEAIRSLLGTPLTSSKGRLLGAILVGNRTPHAFSPDHIALLKTAASQIAVAVENAQLYQDLEQRNVHLNRAYERMQEVARLKDEIIQNVSHELRTPLTFIKGYAELLSEGGMGSLTTEQRECLETITAKTDEVVRLVTEVVSLRPLSNAALDRTAIAVRPLLEEVVSVFEHRTSMGRHQVCLDPIDDDLCIDGDLDKIKQVCYNILDNALKFSPEGGRVCIMALPEDDHVHLTFEDQGIGIPEARLSRIFETFYQVDGSSTRRYGGLGVGLAIVQRVVAAHNGKVWAESKFGKGSRFHVLLPRYVPGQQERA